MSLWRILMALMQDSDRKFRALADSSSQMVEELKKAREQILFIACLVLLVIFSQHLESRLLSQEKGVLELDLREKSTELERYVIGSGFQPDFM